MNIAIIGTGVYGIAIANSLSLNEKNKIIMWSESEEAMKKIESCRKYFEPLNTGINSKIKFSTSYDETLKDADIIFIMCAAKYVSGVMRDMYRYVEKKSHIIIGSKGIEANTCLFIDEIVKKYVSANRVGAMSGGSFAIDIASLEPIGLSLAYKNKLTLDLVKRAFNNSNIKLRGTKDITGIELCGSIKNVIAVAAGILDGLGYRESTRCFLITESLHDIKELINSLNGSKKTILSFAGVGDLLLTATSEKSRNYTYGKLLGQNRKSEAEEYLNSMTVEGYYTLKSIYALLRKKKIKMPIIDLIYNIILNGKDPKSLVEFLMKKQ